MGGIKLVILFFLLLFAAIYDYHTYMIPNQCILLGVFIRIVLAVIQFILLYGCHSFYDMIEASIYFIQRGFIAFLIIAAVGFLTEVDGFGWGDVKLLVVVSLYLSWAALISLVITALLLLMTYIIFCRLKKRNVMNYPFAVAVFIGYLINLTVAAI